MLLRRQSDLMPEGPDKGLCAALAVNFEIEGTKATSLPAEGDMEV
jgi:hypothetical protein